MFQMPSFFMLRIPHLPIEYFDQLEEEDDFLTSLQELSRDDAIEEAITIASTNLQKALPNLYLEEKNKKNKQVSSSFFKYVSRMSSRATPFGLFAGVATGKMGSQTKVSLHDRDQFQTRTRPDMEWLLGIVNQLENTQEIYRQLTFQANNAIQYKANRLVLPFVSAGGQVKNRHQDELATVSINATEPILNVLSYAKKPVKYDVLVKQMLGEYPQATSLQIENMIAGLFKQEFLFSELRPPLTTSNPFQYVLRKLNKLSQVEEIERSLSMIQEKMEQYDRLPIGEGTSYYINLVQQMKELHDVKNPLQVDMALSAAQAELHTKVGEEVMEAARCLFVLSTHDRNQTPLSAYRQEFLEKYGYAREVPILELLDEETGIGAPATYQYPESSRKENASYTTRERDELLMKWVQEAILQGKKEIVLTDEHIKQLTVNEIEKEDLPDSIELYTEILASSSEAIDQGDFQVVLGSILGSNGIGKTFGRFLDMMDEDVKTAIEEVYHKQEQESAAIHAEISYLPRFGRSANVALIDGLRDYEISLGTNCASNTNRLSLDDIVVGATKHRFYLKSRTLDQEVKCSTGHMLNSNTFPNVYRFMREVSVEREHQFESFNWGMAKLSTYLPRLRYRKTILSPAQWYIKPDYLPIDEQEFYPRFRTWAQTWMLPRHVYMIVFDNKILLDTAKKKHVEEILYRLKQNETVQLNEAIGINDNQWVTGPRGHHVMECVFPLVSQNKDVSHSDPVPRRRYDTKDLGDKRFKTIGTDWLYYNIYIGEHAQNDFLIKQLHPFAEGLRAEGLCDQWFYMRYKDPNNHLRLRFHGHPKTLISQVLPKVIEWEKQSNEVGVQRMTIDVYEREVERYGGPSLISLAEEVFFRDSQTSCGLLKILKSNGTSIPDTVLVSLSHIHLMKALGWGLQEQFAYLSSITSKHDYKKEFREWRNDLIHWLQDDFSSFIDEDEGEEIYKLFEWRTQALNTFKTQIDEQSRHKNLWNTKTDIINSLLHMHCNRVAGIDQEFERKSVTFARHAVESTIQYLKHAKQRKRVMS